MQTTATEEAPVANHLIGVFGSEWAFWKCVCLRSAGFPFNGIFKLTAPPDLISAADEVTEAIRVVERARTRARQEVNSTLDDLRSSGSWDDKKTRKALLKAISEISAQGIPRSLPETVQLNSIGELEAAGRQLDTARTRYTEQFAQSSELTTEAICEIAALPDFREAVTWQNRSIMRLALDWLLRIPRDGSARNSRQRQKEELVASYWQRYCAKNDTIGFFGPVGWAWFAPDVDHIVARPGERLCKTRKTYWESWAIEALGEAILRNENVRPWVAPIVAPFVRITGSTLHHPMFGSVPLAAKQAFLLKACDGQDTAKQIAEKLLRLPGSDFRTEGEVYQALSEFAARRFVFWSFNIPMGPHPEQALRSAVQRIGDPLSRRSANASLDEFESAKRRVDASAGDQEKLDAALDHLEQLFERTTGFSATRNHGQTYAGRTIIYEDSCRDLEISLGPQLLRSFYQPLSLLLVAGRWFTSQVADAHRKKYGEIYSQYIQKTGKAAINMADLWTKAIPLFFGDAQKLVAPIQEEFLRRWERILNLGTGSGPAIYSYDELRPQVLKEFPSIRPGWIGARYHSPDIMIAATGEEAIRKGDCLFVLGEVHTSVNTLDASLFVNQHPSPDELLAAVEHDLNGLNVTPLGFKDGKGCRTTPSLVSKSDFRLEYLPDSFIGDRSKSIPISSMVVKNQGGELIVSDSDGRCRLSLIDLMGKLLSGFAVDCFKFMSPQPHTPRILIDRLVIKRESWSFSPSELQFLQDLDPAENFLQIRRWAQAHGIPRFVFFKTPVERKPAYLDFESPILVGIFAKLIRRTQAAAAPGATIDVSEMLPTGDQLWLRDKLDRRYTSEFRFVAVDVGAVCSNNAGINYVC
jgi:lantibiotic biosynthesis dehydratase-like protein